MTVEQIINKALKDSFKDSKIIVKNNSQLHLGHLGDNGTGETHYYVKIISTIFKDKSRIIRHRMVLDVLKPLLERYQVHSLEIEVSI